MVVKIKEATSRFVNNQISKLEKLLRLAQMNIEPSVFLIKISILSLIFASIFSVVFLFLLLKYNLLILIIPVFFSFFFLFFIISLNIPHLNIMAVKREIESDIFTPSRMLLTLLEVGHSLVTALEGVSYTKAKSSKYFGKIASEIYLGKNIDQAIKDAIANTPSESFRRVLEPIKKSLRTGTDIRKNLISTLEDLSREKVIEIEKYEKRLSPLSMFYMIFGTILPAIGVVGIVLIMAIMGIKIEFFPILFILLLLILGIQLIFVRLFKSIRPLVKL